MPPRKDPEESNPWTFIPSQSKYEKAWGLSAPVLSVSVQSPGRATGPRALCCAKGWQFPGSCLGLSPPRARPAAPTAAAHRDTHTEWIPQHWLT